MISLDILLFTVGIELLIFSFWFAFMTPLGKSSTKNGLEG